MSLTFVVVSLVTFNLRKVLAASHTAAIFFSCDVLLHVIGAFVDNIGLYIKYEQTNF